MAKRWPLWVIILFCLFGIAGSLLATYQYFQILKFGFENRSFCNINEFINCDAAYASSHAKLFGIPVAWFGFLFYLWSLLLACWILFKAKGKEEAASLGWLLSLGGIGLSLYKAYVSFVVLKVLCLICVSMYGVNIVLFLAWHSFWSNLSFGPRLKTLVPATLAFFGIGFFVMANYQESLLKETKLNVSTEELLSYHFRSQEYQFDVNPETPLWGNPNAKVTVVEFSDFQCPYCKRAAFHLRPVLSEFKDKVRFYYYNYPIDQKCNLNVHIEAHEHACLAAQAAVCATKEGDFWGYHDDVFRNQNRLGKLGKEFLLELAKKKGWDEKKFESCMEAKETLERVKKDIEAATKIHIEGTPTILVNNRRLRYWGDPDVFRAILKEEIKRRY